MGEDKLKKILKFLLDKNALMYLGVFIMTSNYFTRVTFNSYIWIITLVTSIFLIALDTLKNYNNKYKVAYSLLVKVLLLLLIGNFLTNMLPDTVRVTQHIFADLKAWIGLILIIFSFFRLSKGLAD
jgi:hypothetical protein